MSLPGLGMNSILIPVVQKTKCRTTAEGGRWAPYFGQMLRVNSIKLGTSMSVLAAPR